MKTRKARLLNNALPAILHEPERPIDKLDHVYTDLMLGDRAKVTVGDGERRARERLAEQRAQQEPTPAAAPTRQQRRRHAILRAKQQATLAKAAERKARKK